MRSIILLISLFPFLLLHAVESDSAKTIELSGYMETYYCYDFGQPEQHLRPSFFYSFNRHNELNLNLAYVKASINKTKFRSNLAIMGGTYSTYNLANEKGFLKNIYEANLGYKISKKHQLWIDLGVIPSHIGFESAIGKDCWNLTRSILADNSPYFETGLKLGYTSKKDSFNFNFLVLNGWQKIQYSKYYQMPAFGTQLNYKVNPKTTINWSSFIGYGGADSLKQMRVFNNLYLQYQIRPKLRAIIGFDYGIQQKRDSSLKLTQYLKWYSPVLILQFDIHKKLKLAARMEYYSDYNNVMINTLNAQPFQTMGYSLNLDYKLSESALWRLEGRILQSKEAVFLKNQISTPTNQFITSALSVAF